jgi:hypothetical protein
MKVSAEALKTALAIVDHVPPHSGMPASQFVRMQATGSALVFNLTGLLIAESTITAIEQKKQERWTLILSRSVLASFLSSLTNKTTVDLSVAEKSGTCHAVITAKGRKLEVDSMADVTGYESWGASADKSVTIKLASLKSDMGMITQFSPMVAAAEHWSSLVLVKGYGAVATDTVLLTAILDPGTVKSALLPPLIARTANEAGAGDVVAGETGYGVRFESGYIYQAKQYALKDYPVDSVRTLIDRSTSAAMTFKLSAPKLTDTMGYLKAFAADGANTQVTLTASKEKQTVVCAVTLPNGTTHRTLQGEVAADASLKLPLLRVLPWFAHVGKNDTDVSFNHSKEDGRVNMVLRAGEKTYVLAVAESD